MPHRMVAIWHNITHLFRSHRRHLPIRLFSRHVDAGPDHEMILTLVKTGVTSIRGIWQPEVTASLHETTHDGVE